MTRRLFLIALAGFLITASLVPAMAKGRKPDDEDDDKFPDYNRMEMHPKRKDSRPPAADAEPPAPPPARPSLNTPVNFSVEDQDQPKPPPPVVPVPTGASEPPLPDDMMGTLVPNTTAEK